MGREGGRDEEGTPLSEETANSPLSTAMQEASPVLASLPIFPEKLEIQLTCEISLFFFSFWKPLHFFKNKLFYEPSKTVSACQMWPVGRRCAVAKFSPVPALQTRELNVCSYRGPGPRSQSKEIVEPGFKLFASQPPSSYNTKTWRLITDHRHANNTKECK